METPWAMPLVRDEVAACVTIEPVFASPLFLVYHWHCREESAALTGERHHPWFVLGLPRSGASMVQTGGRSLLLDPGSAAFHAPFSTYTTTHPFGCGDCGWNVAIHPDVLRRTGTGEPVRVVPAPAPELLRWRLALARWRRDPAGEPAAVEEATLALLGGVLIRLDKAGPGRGPRRRDTERDHELVYERARSEILRRYREPLRLAELARAACASPFHLCRVFKRASGISVSRYVSRLRLLAALDVLAERDVSLTDLAADLGFSSHSHFTHAFRRELGLTPSELRERATGRRITAARRVLGRTL